jgi:hypothetical protein
VIQSITPTEDGGADVVLHLLSYDLPFGLNVSFQRGALSKQTNVPVRIAARTIAGELFEEGTAVRCLVKVPVEVRQLLTPHDEIDFTFKSTTFTVLDRPGPGKAKTVIEEASLEQVRVKLDGPLGDLEASILEALRRYELVTGEQVTTFEVLRVDISTASDAAPRSTPYAVKLSAAAEGTSFPKIKDVPLREKRQRYWRNPE